MSEVREHDAGDDAVRQLQAERPDDAAVDQGGSGVRPGVAQGIAEQLYGLSKDLNEAVRQYGPSMTLMETRMLLRTLRETAGWLQGCRDLFEQYLGKP